MPEDSIKTHIPVGISHAINIFKANSIFSRVVFSMLENFIVPKYNKTNHPPHKTTKTKTNIVPIVMLPLYGIDLKADIEMSLHPVLFLPVQVVASQLKRITRLLCLLLL